MANVTAPILLDSTGQSILAKLTSIDTSLAIMAESNITSGNVDLTAGTSPLPDGTLYLYIPS